MTNDVRDTARMLRAGLHAKDAIIAALKLSEPADWDSIIRAVERLAASRRWEMKRVADLEVKNIALYDEMTEKLTAAEMALEHHKDANARLRAALKRRVLAEEMSCSGKSMSDDELNEFCDHIEKDGPL